MRNVKSIRSAVENGGPAIGTVSMTVSPKMVEVYADSGFDYVWLDFEHDGFSPYDSSKFRHLVRTAEAADIDLLVRLPSGEPHLIRKVLDTGIRSLLIPRVETAGEVKRAVRASRFDYEGGAGDRGVAAGRPSSWGGSLEQFLIKEDQQVMVGVMIENESAVENLDSILEVPELGFVFIGPADLSVSLGHPMKMNHPEVQNAVEKIRTTCQDYQIPIGCIANRKEDIQEALDQSFDIIRIGSEVSAVRESLTPLLELAKQ